MTPNGKTDLEREADQMNALEPDVDETRGVVGEEARRLEEEPGAPEAKSKAPHVADELGNRLGDRVHGYAEAAAEKVREVRDATADKLHQTREAAAHRLEKASSVVHGAVDSASHVLDDAGKSARRAGETSVAFVRQNAVPLAVVGVGLTWLVANAQTRARNGAPRRSDSGQDSNGARAHASGMKSSAAHMASRVGSEAHRIADRAEHAVSEQATHARQVAERQFSRAKDELVRWRDTSREAAENNPLLIGAVALAAGFGVALLLPSTHRENEVFGATRDRLLESARTKVHDLGETAKDIGHTVKDTARDIKDTVAGTA